MQDRLTAGGGNSKESATEIYRYMSSVLSGLTTCANPNAKRYFHGICTFHLKWENR